MDIFVIITFVISILIGVLAIPNIVLISKKKRLFDTLNSRKSHTKTDVPRLGGVSFVFALFFSFCLVLGIRCITGHDIDPSHIDKFYTEFAFLTASTVMLFFIGLTDDLIELNYKVKFYVQIMASLMIIASDLYIKNLEGLFGIYALHPIVGVLLTVGAIVLIINAYNLIDGIDGLCSGLAISSIGTFSVWFWAQGYYIYAMVGFSLAGCLVAFFFYNVSKRRLKVFMGDAGSLVIGLVICFLGLKFIDISTMNISSSNNAIIVTLAIIFVPLFDTIRVFIDRIRAGKGPFSPDKTHIHHLMLQLGFSHLQSTTVIISLSIVIMIVNLLLCNIDINILFAIDVVYGLMFLCFIPKFFIKKGIKLGTYNAVKLSVSSKKRRSKRNNNVAVEENIGNF